MKKRKVRQIKFIEEELNEHEEKYKKHLIWIERNIKYKQLFDEKTKMHFLKIESIKSEQCNFIRYLGFIKTSKLKPEIEQYIEQISQKIESIKLEVELENPKPNFPYQHCPNGREMYSDWKMIPIYLGRELELAQKIYNKNEKKNIIKAKAASLDQKSRNIAISIKLQLEKFDFCPYCQNELGNEPHADHIYPIVKGGLSIKANMVYICKSCNLKKHTLTLRAFVEKHELNWNFIEENLKLLKKDF